MPRAGRRSPRRRQTGGQLPNASEDARADDAAAAPVHAASAAVPMPAQTVRPRRGTPRPTAGTQAGRSSGPGRLYRWTHPRLLTETVSELRKVVWPSRTETRSLTTVVVVIAVAVGVLLGSVDWIFNRIMENILLS
jgi:preprotein translocase subunit SecE